MMKKKNMPQEVGRKGGLENDKAEGIHEEMKY